MQMLFDELMALEDGKPVPMPLQMDFLERGRACCRDGVRRVLFQAPCGAGKTVVASEQTRRALALGKTVLHFAPLRKLVDQMIGMLRRFGIQASPIMAGRQTWSSNVYCASRDTLLAMLKDGAALPPADLLIQDEAHVAAWEVQNYYLQRHPDSYWSGYTATPVHPDGSSLAPPWQALVSMAPTSTMVELGRLVPVKLFDPDAVGRRRRKGDKTKPVGDPVAHWKKYAPDMPSVVFAATIADSKAIVERYCAAGVTAEHIDAFTPEDDREAVFERSRTGVTKIVSNVGVLIMGVDLPWIVCVQILRGCGSLVLFYQAIGRAMRAYEGKTHAIILDHSGATHEYWRPNGDFVWSLSDADANKRVNKPPKDRKPVTCLGCGLIFTGGPACPECGRVLPMKRRKSLLDGIKPGDGVLTEFTGEQNGHVQRDVWRRLFERCYRIACARGATMGMASAMFSRDAKMPPWQADLPFKLPNYGEWKTPARDWRLT